MDFSIYNNDNSKLNKINPEAGTDWSEVSKQADNKILDSIWKLVDNGDGKIQQNELDLLNKLMNIADKSTGKADKILNNNELTALQGYIADGSIKEVLDTRTFGTIKGDNTNLENFSYLDKGADIDLSRLTPTQRRMVERKNKSVESFVVNVDYSNMKMDKDGEYFIEEYKRTKNPDGTYTETPVLTKKQDSGQGRSYNWSEGLDRQIGKISLANYESDSAAAKQMPVIIEELRAIGKEAGFEVEEIGVKTAPWVEDYGIRRADGKVMLVSDETASEIKHTNFEEIISDRKNISKSTQGNTAKYYKEFQNTVREGDIVQGKSYLEGGNVLNTCLADGTAGAVIGSESINYTLQTMNLENTPENIEKAKNQIAQDLGLKPENITFIPQYDFHIDMTYRPLHNGEIAVPDYEEAIRILQETRIAGMDDNTKSELIKNLEELNTKSAAIRQEAEQALTEGGYRIVKIPCFAENGQSQINFMNGVGGTSKTGQSFYITNKSDYPELNDAIQTYFNNAGVDKVYFVSTLPFLNNYGGIDCLTQEV